MNLKVPFKHYIQTIYSKKLNRYFCLPPTLVLNPFIYISALSLHFSVETYTFSLHFSPLWCELSAMD